MWVQMYFPRWTVNFADPEKYTSEDLHPKKCILTYIHWTSYVWEGLLCPGTKTMCNYIVHANHV